MNNIKISTAIISTSLLLSSFSLGIQAQSASAHYYHASESVAKSSMDEIKEASKKDRSETIAAVSKNLSSITKTDYLLIPQEQKFSLLRVNKLSEFR